MTAPTTPMWMDELTQFTSLAEIQHFLDVNNVRVLPSMTREQWAVRLWKVTQRGLLDWSNPLARFQAIYTFDANRFVREVCGATPDDWQDDVLTAASNGKRKIAVRSGHGVGKTAVISWLNIWFLCMFNPAKLVVTATSAGTIEDGIGAEIKMWMGRLPKDVQALFSITGERIELKSDPEGTFLTMRTSRPENPQAIAGIHAPHICLTVDEASVLPDTSYETVGSSMSAPHAIMLLIGNPTMRDGYFYDCFHKMRDSWVCIHVNAEHSKRVDPDFIRDIITRYGRQSNVFRVRVQGEFPLGNDDAVIPAFVVESAVDRDVEPTPHEIVWGLDVARSLARDASRLVKRRGNTILRTPIERLDARFDGPLAESLHTPASLGWQYDDHGPLIGAIKIEWDNTPESKRPVVICVDGTGFGATVADVLRSLGLPAIAINTGERLASNAEHYNVKCELWVKAREWFMGMLCVIPKDGQFMEECSTPMFKPHPTGQLMIESKEEIRKRKQWSPDAADAFVLTFAHTAALAMPGRATRDIGWNQPLRRNVALV